MNLPLILLAMALTLYLLNRTVQRTVARRALAGQPDRITLESISAHSWKDAALAESTSEALTENGFEEAGTYRVAEMPGLVVRLLANREESLYAALYEHPRAGIWFDITARYQDSTSITFTTAPVAGLAQRPGHRTVHDPQANAFQLCERALAERPEGSLKPATASRAVHDFEESYGESIAWRKTHGISPEEVGKVAARRRAA